MIWLECSQVGNTGSTFKPLCCSHGDFFDAFWVKKSSKAEATENCEPDADCIMSDCNTLSLCGDAEALIRTDGSRTFGSDSIEFWLHLYQTNSACWPTRTIAFFSSKRAYTCWGILMIVWISPTTSWQFVKWLEIYKSSNWKKVFI